MTFKDPLTEPDRIAIAGDWHGDTDWACRAVDLARSRGAETLLHAGDFGYEFQPRFLARLDRTLNKARMPLLFIDGNHDDHLWLQRQRLARNGLRPITDWIWHIPRGFRWTWHGIRFTGLGGAHSVDSAWRRKAGQMWQKEETITDEQAAMVKAGGRTDVLLSHDCPAGTPIPHLHPEDFPPVEIMHAEDHRRLLRDIVDVLQPRMIWHGHYHVGYHHVAQFGHGGVSVRGLDGNGSTMSKNMDLVDLHTVAKLLGDRS